MQFIPNSPIPPSGMISRTLAIGSIVYHRPYDYQTNIRLNRRFYAGHEHLRRRNDARRLLPHRRREAGDLFARSRRYRAAALAGKSAASDRYFEPRQVLFRSARREDEAVALLARVRVDLRRVGND